MFFKSTGYKEFYSDFIDAFYKKHVFSYRDYSGYVKTLFTGPVNRVVYIDYGYSVHAIPGEFIELNVPDLATDLNNSYFGLSDTLISKSPIKLPVYVSVIYNGDIADRPHGIAPFTLMITLTHDGTKWTQDYLKPDHIFYWVYSTLPAENFDLRSYEFYGNFYASYNYLFPFPPTNLLE